MIESAPDGMLLTDADGRILAVNQQLELLFGYDRSELVGQSIERLLPERSREVHRRHRDGYRERPTVRAMGEGLQLRARRSDGTEFPVEVSLSPLDDDEGLAVVASVRDVSERQRLTAHTQRIQAAIDAVHDGVFMFETDTLRFVYANDGASTQTGYSNDELLTMTPIDIKPEFTRAQFEALIAPLIEGVTEHLSFRTVHRTKTGTDVPVDIVLEHRRPEAAISEFDAHTGALLVAIVRDVTAQVAVEQRLAESEETFRTSFEQAPVGMSLALTGDDGSRRLEAVNASFTRMLGRTAESLVGADFVDLCHPDDRRQTVDAWDEMARGERDSFVTEKRYRRADGSYVWALVHSSVIGRSGGTRTLTHIVDISDRRERQVERARLATMEDRERIARDIHDLVIQRLFGAGLKLQSVIPSMGSAAAVDRTNETIDELDETIRELRSSIFSLHRRDDTQPAADRLALAVDQAVERLGFRPSLDIDGPLDAVGHERLSELEATMREALSNVARHAEAASVDIAISVTGRTLTLTVIDDGRGVDPHRSGGNGVKNMAARAARLGGTFEFGAAPAGGCALTWSVPR